MSLINPLIPPLPKTHDNLLHWGNLYGSSASLVISKLAEHITKPILLITSHLHELNRIKRELHFFSKNEHLPIVVFPDWETLPYDYFSPHQDLISERLLTLFKLSRLSRGIIIVALPTIMHRLLPKSYLNEHFFVLAIGEILNIEQWRQQLTNSGYRHVEQVLEHGEFAVRGSIIDIFPTGSHLPYRIELFDDQVESIRSFDPETQRSIERIQQIRLLPAREYPLTENSISHFRQAWRAKFAGNPMESPIYKAISRGESAAGIEYYLPLFFNKTQSFFDYLPQQVQLILIGDLLSTGKNFWREINERYEQLRFDINRPLCEPNELFIPIEEIFSLIKKHQKIYLHEKQLPAKRGHVNFAIEQLPTLLINHKLQKPLNALENFINIQKCRVLFFAESSGRRETLYDLLKEIAIFPQPFPSWHDFAHSQAQFGITVASFDQGCYITDPPLALITESQLFGEQVMQRRLRKRTEIDPNLLIRNLTELSIGAPVVHIEHGVGRYLGLEKIKTANIEAEYLTLEYAGGDKIYVPVTALHLISRYTGMDPEHAPLTRLGTKQWEKTKEKAAKRIHDIAAELLEAYSKRETTHGFIFSKPGKEFQLFRTAFPFEETPDQTQAIETVIADMTSPRCMDRLICGDVGFGKTEVAMQAAFLAVQDAKQVAVLVPTTLLATQHLQTFRDRFADWPIKITALSRLRTKKEQDNIIDELSMGKIDIIIGTHKLLQPNIKFNNLGLLIVDEEHRFGVRQKERIKTMRAQVDILTLTATPIPRTLNMAFAGTRDLTIISTPPARRLSIKTFVHETNSILIREAVLREIMRGGQVYFLHNEVATINAMAEKLQKTVPEAQIAIAHGQMRERDLERVMTEFYQQKFNTLICTTIIESGIDIPTANTIIINRANKFGLAQLHQLRGRVGRSHHQAYAYLLIPSKKTISRDAIKRLEAISALEELGVGFQLATHDLEIRGAGELLGAEQSGHIEAIGFSLYMELLEEAVSTLKKGEEAKFSKARKSDCDIDLHVSALIPDNYIADVHTRLTLYKRLTHCKNNEKIQELKAEMIDRFGLLPEVTQMLFQIAQLKLQAIELGIKKIDAGLQYGYLHFAEKPNIEPNIIIQMIQTQPNIYSLHGAHCLRFKMTQSDPKLRVQTVSELLKTLTHKS